MKLVINIDENEGRLKTTVSRLAIGTVTQLETGVADYLEKNIKAMLDHMFDGAEAMKGGAQ
jgi:hypothetical protein